MSRLFAYPAGRRAKWGVFLGWFFVVFMAVGPLNLVAKFADAEKNESTSFLPGDAESTAALKASERIQGGELAPVVIVYRRDGGPLTGADRGRIAADRAELNGAIRSDREIYRSVVRPFAAPVPSPDGQAALLIASIKGDGSNADSLIDPVDDIRKRVSGEDGGLAVKVTGGAGYSTDAIKIFESINGTLLMAGLALVLLLLILIYRSPIFLFIPLLAVVFAEMMTRALGYGLTEAGVTVNGQSSSILSILVLGAGTDYALLIVARYREELRHHEDRHDALARAMRSAGPAVFASGMTVIAALLCLSIAKVNGTAGLGPIGALGIAVAMLAMLTVLPALLVICGRRAFWPRVPHYGDEGVDVTHGGWRRVGERVAASPRRVWIGALVLLGVLSLGMFNLDNGLTTGNSYRDKVESVEGQDLIAKSFPAGANAPTDIIVPDAARVPAVLAAVRAAPGVADVRRVEADREGTLLNATLEPEPYSTEAYALVAGIREAARGAGGDGTLVGGATAVEQDLREAAAWDTRVIVPIALVVVFVILVLLLRALLAPLILIGTVVVSFFASLGVGVVVFDVIFGFPGVDPSLPLFAFVFLVALGVDYNIFLMARVREESLKHGTRRGMLRGLAVTGGVITSAGIVLAGTFLILAVLPLVFLTEIGFVVAFGVLLDTFIVRSILVPALAFDIGPRIWWPSTLSHSIDRRELFVPGADREAEATEPARA
ncbi:MAG: MMPL family transporter [Solirubrobacteraceae bacterium]